MIQGRFHNFPNSMPLHSTEAAQQMFWNDKKVAELGMKTDCYCGSVRYLFMMYLLFCMG